MSEARPSGGDGIPRAARDLEEFEFHDDGQDWVGSWHPPTLPPPKGTPHGSAAVCLTVAGQVVLITADSKSWGLPGGRPMPGEDWRATLEREVLEEACARVDRASLLGFVRGVCVRGSDEGLVIVRSLWLAYVSLLPWEPRHEIRERALVPPDSVLSRVDHPVGLRPIYRRWFHEALTN